MMDYELRNNKINIEFENDNQWKNKNLRKKLLKIYAE